MADKKGLQVTTKKQRQWRAHINAWQKAGISQTEYCRQYGLSSKLFTYYKGKFKSLTQPISFLQVATTNNLAYKMDHRRESLRLIMKDRFHIEVGDGFSTATLQKLICTLEGI